MSMLEKGDIVPFSIGGRPIRIGIFQEWVVKDTVTLLDHHNLEWSVDKSWFVAIPQELRKEPIEVVKLYLAL